MKKLFLLLGILVLFGGCTEQNRSRAYGGTMTITLEPGDKLIEVTWKDDGNLWYLVEPMEEDYIPKTKRFVESSNWGVLEGEVIFIERK